MAKYASVLFKSLFATLARAGLKHKFHNSATFNVLFRQSSRQPKQDWIFIETSFNDLEGVFK